MIDMISSKRRRIADQFQFNKEAVFIGILGFFLSRGVILGELTPFGVSFFSSYLLNNNSIGLLLIISLGLLSFHGIKGFVYIFSMIGIYFFYEILKRKRKISYIKMSFLSSLVFFFTRILFLIIFRHYYIYDFLIVFFEGIVVFTMTYIFFFSTVIENNNFDIITNEKTICTFITLALALSGVKNAGVLGISVKNIISIFTVISFGYIYGASLGGAMGIAVGMISYLPETNMPFLISIFGLSGLMSGVFKDLGKTGAILGFLMGNSIMNFYISGFNSSLLNLKEIGIGAILFLIFSSRIEKFFSDFLKNPKELKKDENMGKRIQGIVSNRIERISNVFSEMGEVFVHAAEKETDGNSEDMYDLIDGIANTVCNKCSLNKFCWGEDFYTTYYSMFNLIEKIETEEEIREENLPELFRKRCVKVEDMIENIYKYYDIHKINYTWKKRVSENRKLVSEQFKEISEIMNELVEDINAPIVFNRDLEEIIYTELKNNKINVSNVNVLESSKRKLEIFVEVKNTCENENVENSIKEILSDILKIELSGEFNLSESKKKNQIYKFTQAKKISAMTSFSTIYKEGNHISGDTFTYMESKDNYYIALSDGMGAGQKANSESNTAISMLEKCLEAGFNKEMVLSTINSMLFLKGNEETFVTLDISAIDLFNGKLQTIKTGAAPTFIKKKNGVKMINSQSLPVGMLKDVDFQVCEEYLEDGDFIIMMSDGVLESNEEVIDKEEWMMEVIKNIKSINPQTISKEIIEEAKRKYKDYIKDDTTVLVTKIWKNR